MNPQIIRFRHFYDEQSYCKLQEYFGSFDYQNRYLDGIKTPLEDFTIMDYEVDEFSQKEDYKDLSFLNDFLYPEIFNLSKNYIKNFDNEINKKGLFTKELLDGFAKHYRDRIIQLYEDIENCDFHKSRTKSLLFVQISEFEEYVEKYFENPYPNIKSKMQFNWSRTQIIYFFHLLRINKEIAWMEDADIGRIVDNVFEFQNQESGQYLPIDLSRKHFTAFKNTEGRPEKKVNDELKRLFINEDFYNV